MGNERKGFLRRLLGRRKEEEIALEDEEFEGLFEAEPGAAPGERSLSFESVCAALLDTGEYLKTVAGTIQETNRKIGIILGELKEELEEYRGAESRRKGEGAADAQAGRENGGDGEGLKNGGDGNRGH